MQRMQARVADKLDADRLARYAAMRDAGKMLDALPPERTLVLRTRDLGPMRGRLAAFAGQSAASLTGTGHSNAGPPGPSPLDGLPEGWLARAAAEICNPVHARVLERCAG